MFEYDRLALDVTQQFCFSAAADPHHTAMEMSKSPQQHQMFSPKSVGNRIDEPVG